MEREKIMFESSFLRSNAKRVADIIISFSGLADSH